MSEKFIIRGSNPVGGTLRPAGNKNAALPLIAATLLTEEDVVLRNIPDIADVRILIELMQTLGVTVEPLSAGAYRFNARSISTKNLGTDQCARIRASVLLAGPLLARLGEVSLPPPGGDVIGRRRLDTHVLALRSLGATVTHGPKTLTFSSSRRLQGQEIFLDEASVTGTENAIMAAALADGKTTLLNAASEPHVQDLCRLVTAMGAEVDGIGTNRIIIHGAKQLGGADYAIGPDYIEVGSFITLAAVTGGELRLVDARPEEHRATKIAFDRIGIRFEASEDGKDIIVPKDQEMRVREDLGGHTPKIEDAVWPGFPADLTSLAVVGATQSQGTSMVHEKLFESRLFFVDRLAAMGAKVILCDPHRVVITGRAQLYGQELVSPDIRAGMALVIAALCAEGESTIHNIQQVDRGYERIDARLRELGADITRVQED